MVTNPSCKTYIEGYDSADRAGRASAFHEREKYNDYDDFRINPNHFYPFAVEATGRLGDRAKELLRTLEKEFGGRSLIKRLVDQINLAIVRHNAKLILDYRNLINSTAVAAVN